MTYQYKPRRRRRKPGLEGFAPPPDLDALRKMMRKDAKASGVTVTDEDMDPLLDAVKFAYGIARRQSSGE